MTLAEMHQRLDQLEGAIDAELAEAKAENARRIDRLRALKGRASSMRVALAMGRLEPMRQAESQATVTEINRFKGGAA